MGRRRGPAAGREGDSARELLDGGFRGPDLQRLGPWETSRIQRPPFVGQSQAVSEDNDVVHSPPLFRKNRCLKMAVSLKSVGRTGWRLWRA